MLLVAELLAAALCSAVESKIPEKEKSLGDTYHYIETRQLSSGKLILGFCFCILVTKKITCEQHCLGPPKASLD